MTQPRTGFAVAIAAALLGGCAAGGTYNYAEMPVAMQGVSTAGTVAIAVHDTRPYVVSGSKPPSFVGLMRGGYGNPFDVNTQSGGTLAVEMRDALAKALRARGATPIPVVVTHEDSARAARERLMATKAQRSLLLTLREWKTDTMLSTDFHYDTTVAVYDQAGNQLAHHSLKGMDPLGGLGLSPKEGISRATARKLDALFDDSRVAGALR
ncbi:MAG: hypothetical protein ABIR98_00520 [Usitatibacter sp.]